MEPVEHEDGVMGTQPRGWSERVARSAPGQELGVDLRELAEATRVRAMRDRAEAIEMSRRAVAMRRSLEPSSPGADISAAAQAAFESLPTAAAVVSSQGVVTATNPAWRSLIGKAVPLGGAFSRCWQAVGGDPAVVGAVELAVRGAARTDLESDLSIGPTKRLMVQVASGSAREASAVIVVIDITAQHELEQQLLFEASHDSLTGLANRAWLVRELGTASLRLNRYGERYGLVYLDLNDFKWINDTHGHGVGDDLLRQVARRWDETVRAPDLLARVGGDEFVVLVPHVDGDGQLAALARRLSEALSMPFAVGALEVTLSTAFGVIDPPAEAQPEEVLGLADHAMYEQKRLFHGDASRSTG